MASWGSPASGQSRYRDSSPISPLSPLSPSSIPQWLRPSRSSRTLTGGRLKMFFLALICLAMGWMFTSLLGPGDDLFDDMEVEGDGFGYETASAGVLNEPSGFGGKIPLTSMDKRPGIIGADVDEDGKMVEEPYGDDEGGEKEPSVKNALSELHHAVSHKIGEWSPYLHKGIRPPKKGKGKGSMKQYNATSHRLKGEMYHNGTMGGEDVREGWSEEERLGSRIRIGKATVLFSGNDFWERCIRTHERHDKVNGYRLHVLRQQLIDDVWSKPAYILSLLLREMSKPKSERLDWLFWADADTVIMNPNVPIETFLPPQGTEFDDVYLMYSNDWNGLNNGVFPIRVNQWAVELFSGIVAYRHFKPEEPLVFRDQSAMNNLMNEPRNKKHIIQAPQRWFNAYQGEHNETLQAFQVRRGDLLVHFAGVGDREARMHYWLQRAEQHLDEWEIPVKGTSYPQEAKDFWNDQHRARKEQKEKLITVQNEATALLKQIDQQLMDFGDRVKDEERFKIGQAKDKLKLIRDKEDTRDDMQKLEVGIKELKEASQTLLNAQSEEKKVLLQTAHEALFDAEIELREHGFHDGASSPEADAVATGIKVLKALVMAPEESWSRHDIQLAVNGLTDERAKLTAALQKAMEQAQAKEDELKALQEAKLAAQLEAEKYAAGTPDAAPGPDVAPVHEAAPTVPDSVPPQEQAPGVHSDLETVQDEAAAIEALQPGETLVLPPLDAIPPPPAPPEMTPAPEVDKLQAEAELKKIEALKAEGIDPDNIPDNVVLVGITKTVEEPVVVVAATEAAK